MGPHKSAPERCTYHYFPVGRGNALSATKTKGTLSSFSRGSQDSVFIFASGLGGGKLRQKKDKKRFLDPVYQVIVALQKMHLA